MVPICSMDSRARTGIGFCAGLRKKGGDVTGPGVSGRKLLTHRERDCQIGCFAL